MTTQTNPKPDKPFVEDPGELTTAAGVPECGEEGPIYTLEFKDRSYMGSINFRFAGNHREAISRAMLYCERMRYRFIHCKPFLTDLSVNEQKISRF